MASVDDALRIAVRENRDFAISTLLELVALDSLGPNESEAQGAYLRAAQLSGLEAVLVPIPTQELERHPRHAYTGLPYFDRPNVEVRLAGGAASPLIFNSHIDTVNASDGWSRPVYGEVTENLIYGLGSADAKGCLVAALVALRTLKQLSTPLSGDVVIQSVIDEEGSGNGTLAALLASTDQQARMAIVLEPTDLAVAYGHRGMLSYELLCRGISAHGATAGGVNAITIAARAVLELEQLATTMASFKEDGYAPVRINVGLIEGGREIYTTPDRCVIRFTVRYGPHQRELVMQRVADTVANLATFNSGAEAPPKLTLAFDYDAAETGLDSGLPMKFLQTAVALRPDTRATTLAGTCDARHLVNYAGIPTLIFGPGRLEDAHAADEHVAIDDVLEAATILATFAATI